MINQKIIVIYIAISLVIIISVLCMGIDKLKKRVDKNKPSQWAKGPVADKKLGSNIQIKSKGPKITKVNKAGPKKPVIDLSNSKDLKIIEGGGCNIKKELEIIEEVSSLNALLDNKDNKSEEEEEQRSINEGLFKKRLKEEIRGYSYQNENSKFNSGKKNIILDILTEVVPGVKSYSLLDIKAVSNMWIEQGDKIIEQIENHPNDGVVDIVLVNNPDLIYNHLKEFLFLCIPRTVEQILTDAFSNHVVIIKSLTGDNRLAVYTNDEELKDLYPNNVEKQLYMFIRAIDVINNRNNKIIDDIMSHLQDAIEIGKNKLINCEDIQYSIIDMYLKTVIQITLELKLKPINLKILDLAKNLWVNLIKLIEQYSPSYTIHNTKNDVINTTELIDLISKVYNGSASEEEKKELNKMLIL